MRSRIAVGGLSVALGIASPAAAQDAHYWTHQYGTRATLLGGAVIGSALEVSATYYNPGALSLLEDAAVIAASRVVEYGSVTVRGEHPDTPDLRQARLDLAPSFFGGLLPVRLGRGHVFGYSLFTRQQFATDLTSAATGALEGIPGMGPGTFAGLVDLRQDLNETWVGLSWGYQLGARSGVGVSSFATVRNQKGTGRVELQASTIDGATVTSRVEQSLKLYHYGVLLKAGASFQWLGWSLGITATTPRLGAFGSATYRFNRTAIGLDLDADGIPDSYAAVTYQDNLPVTYKSSWAIGLGGTRRLGATRLHGSAEWYAAVDSFTVFQGDAVVAQPGADSLPVGATYALDGVVNVGGGVEHAFAPWLSGYASAQTNFSARRPDGSATLSVGAWDAYYLTAGAAFRFRGADITLGLSYGFGNDTVPLDEIDPPDPILGTLGSAIGVDYRAWRLIVAFSL